MKNKVLNIYKIAAMFYLGLTSSLILIFLPQLICYRTSTSGWEGVLSPSQVRTLVFELYKVQKLEVPPTETSVDFI